MTEQTTDFGYEQVSVNDKAKRVRGVFDSVAEHYDVMNDLMSLGLHRWWKHYAASLPLLPTGAQILDVASGSGDLAYRLKQRIGDRGQLVVSDINPNMLAFGRDKLLDRGICEGVDFVLADAESLPFTSNRFDLVSIGFGLRNVTHQLCALKQCRRVLKPGGQLMVLEFSEPQHPGLKRVYDAYSFGLLPRLGGWVANDAASYRYLAESIRMHPNQAKLTELMQSAGLEDVTHQNLCGGIVAIHCAYKY